MRISELMEQLGALQAEHGDIGVLSPGGTSNVSGAALHVAQIGSLQQKYARVVVAGQDASAAALAEALMPFLERRRLPFLSDSYAGIYVWLGIHHSFRVCTEMQVHDANNLEGMLNYMAMDNIHYILRAPKEAQ